MVVAGARPAVADAADAVAAGAPGVSTAEGSATVGSDVGIATTCQPPAAGAGAGGFAPAAPRWAVAEPRVPDVAGDEEDEADARDAAPGAGDAARPASDRGACAEPPAGGLTGAETAVDVDGPAAGVA
ncbi:MAG: hypothetical protein ABWX65_13175, partial [Mycetocola sp.]